MTLLHPANTPDYIGSRHQLPVGRQAVRCEEASSSCLIQLLFYFQHHLEDGGLLLLGDRDPMDFVRRISSSMMELLSSRRGNAGSYRSKSNFHHKDDNKNEKTTTFTILRNSIGVWVRDFKISKFLPVYMLVRFIGMA